MPTRFAKQSTSLLDHIFVKTQGLNSKSGILFTSISHHLAPFTFLQENVTENITSKFVTVTKQDEISIRSFIESISKSNLIGKINRELTTDPNITQKTIESEIKYHMDQHLPTKRVRFNKYKHKKSPWITAGILKSMRLRDKLYYKLKTSNPNTAQYQTV